MTSSEIRHVDDPSALKALAHPLRVRLLAELRESGPATATELAKRLDTESGSTSYHLRVLAKHGFVADAEPDDAGHESRPRHPRERRWAAVHRLTSWSGVALSDSPAGREAVALMRRRQVEVLIGDVEQFEVAAPHLDPGWLEVAGIGDLLVRLRAESVTELWDRFYGHLDELVARDQDDPAAEQVSVVVAAFPRSGS